MIINLIILLRFKFNKCGIDSDIIMPNNNNITINLVVISMYSIYISSLKQINYIVK